MVCREHLKESIRSNIGFSDNHPLFENGIDWVIQRIYSSFSQNFDGDLNFFGDLWHSHDPPDQNLPFTLMSNYIEKRVLKYGN